MQDNRENFRNPAVEHWLESIPSPSLLNEESVAGAGNMFMSWRKKEHMDAVYLQGNQCFVKTVQTENENHEKKKKSETAIPKRVTFKTNGGDSDLGEEDEDKEDPNVQTDFRLMRRKTDRDRLELAKNMNQHLISVYQRKLFERSKPFVYESQRSKSPGCYVSMTPAAGTNTTKEAGTCEHFDERRITHEGRDSTSTGESSVGLQKQPRWSPRPSPNSVTMGTKKPLIRGLVVDSASNQKPSIVRASKNANIREEFALQQKISGYRKACTHNIKTIKMVQRRLGTGLQRLRSKMAQNKMDEKQMSEFRNTSDQLFLRNKGYMPTRKDSIAHFWFPPLRYQRRRVMTVL